MAQATPLTVDTAHFNMIEQQIRPAYVLDAAVLAAIKAVPRILFVREDQQALAYADTELPMGEGQTMLSPILAGRMLQALQVKSTETVLHIGAGTGYVTALLASLSAQVTAVELYADLATAAAKNLAQAGIEHATVVMGDAVSGWDIADRVDVIMLTAAVVTVPETYLHDLAVGGRLAAVVGSGGLMPLQVITRTTEREWSTQTVMETTMPPMVHGEPTIAFEF